MKPSVGRIVHYPVFFSRGTEQGHEATLETCAAIIVSTCGPDDMRASLTVFLPDGELYFVGDRPFSDVPAVEHWSWPPRV